MQWGYKFDSEEDVYNKPTCISSKGRIRITALMRLHLTYVQQSLRIFKKAMKLVPALGIEIETSGHPDFGTITTAHRLISIKLSFTTGIITLYRQNNFHTIVPQQCELKTISAFHDTKRMKYLLKRTDCMCCHVLYLCYMVVLFKNNTS